MYIKIQKKRGLHGPTVLLQTEDAVATKHQPQYRPSPSSRTGLCDGQTATTDRLCRYRREERVNVAGGPSGKPSRVKNPDMLHPAFK